MQARMGWWKPLEETWVDRHGLRGGVGNCNVNTVRENGAAEICMGYEGVIVCDEVLCLLNEAI